MELDTKAKVEGSCYCCNDSKETGGEDVPEAHVPWRVFVNHVDSYHTAKLTDFLLDQEYDASVFGVQPKKNVGKEEEEEDDEKNEQSIEPKTMKRKFELVGTVMDHKYTHESVKIIPSLKDDQKKFVSEIMKCGYVIYDVSQLNEESQIVEANFVVDEIIDTLERWQKSRPRAFESLPGTRRFVLISSLMTWARTKLTSISDLDYRKRKSHPDYRDLLHCERKVGRKKSPAIAAKFQTRIVCSGITYGGTESRLHYAFKLAWLNENNLPIVVEDGRVGNNLLPILHVRDLASIVYEVMKKWPKTRYVIAAEQKMITQKKLIKTIGKQFGGGGIKLVTKEEARLMYPNDLTRIVIDSVTLDLNLQPIYLSSKPSLLNFSFCENALTIAHEYVNSRDLRPVRICVLGPPASGKSCLARALANHYRLPLVVLGKKLLNDIVRQLTKKLNEAKDANSDDENYEEEEVVEEEEEDTSRRLEEDLLNDIRCGLNKNNGRLDDELLTRIFRYKLRSRECMNQGYVLDGYPKTLNQARLLFAVPEDSHDVDFSEEEEEEDDEEEDDDNEYDDNEEEEKVDCSFLPEVVIVLEARDDFLIERMIKFSEEELRDTHYTEDHMIRRLKIYREQNNEENTPLQLFDELEIYPKVINVERNDGRKDYGPEADLVTTFRLCQDLIGPPRNYGLSQNEVAEEKKRVELLKAIEADKTKREYAERRREREKKAQEWMKLKESFREEEEMRLCLEAEPLRHYLVEHVFPVLIRGLTQVAKLRPDDPIDYLAEYLFESNPEGRAFQPDYTERLNFITTAVQQLQKDGFLQSCASSSSSSSLDYCIYELLSIASTDDDKCEGEKFILGTENDVSS